MKRGTEFFSEFLIVTGLSGAGKSTAIKILEDIGFYCVDNLPVKLLPALAQWYLESSRPSSKVALGIDVREGEAVKELPFILRKLSSQGIRTQILYLEAEDEVIFIRFKETRRVHPLRGLTLRESLNKEKELLLPIREEADYIIDTSQMAPHQLRDTLRSILGEDEDFLIIVTSFGFKYGIPKNVDLLFDVRFLPNPYFSPDLKEKSGLDPAVKDFVLLNKDTKEFLERLKNFILYLLPLYLKEGKSYLWIGIGCTGGVHRSVVIAEWLKETLNKMGYPVKLFHRELQE